MTLVLRRVREPGKLQLERVVMRAQSDVDIGDYILCRAKSVGEQIFADIDFSFWFPDKQVRAGDWIVLYTRSGISKEKETESGSTTHFFYCEKTAALWATADFSVVLMHTDSWNALRPSKFIDSPSR